MTQFYFYHYSKDLQTASLPEDKNIAIWETCLRKIIFIENLEQNLANQKYILDFYQNEQALIFIIEVLCGLQSKVVGETEIFGQFKRFLESENAKKVSFFKNPRFIQFLFKQVKEIRDKYITQLGVNSYGSMIRKICQSEAEISLIGYGQLAKKILPWIKNRKVKVHVRDKSKYKDQENMQFLNLDEMDFYSTLIIAAPVKTTKVACLIGTKTSVQKIVDCRSLDGRDHSIKQIPEAQNTEVIDLKDLFAHAEAKQDKIKSMLPIIKQEIAERVQAYFLKSQHRPQGWEDLCG